MSRAAVISIACGLLAAIATYALIEFFPRTRLFSPSHPSNAIKTEHDSYEVTADGKPIRPKCGRSDNVLEYQCGLRREAPPKGKINGGCVIGSKSPEYKCGHCRTNFGIFKMDH